MIPRAYLSPSSPSDFGCRPHPEWFQHRYPFFLFEKKRNRIFFVPTLHHHERRLWAVPRPVSGQKKR